MLGLMALLGLSDAPQTAQEAPKTAQEAPKTAPRRPQEGPKRGTRIDNSSLPPENILRLSTAGIVGEGKSLLLGWAPGNTLAPRPSGQPEMLRPAAGRVGVVKACVARLLPVRGLRKAAPQRG